MIHPAESNSGDLGGTSISKAEWDTHANTVTTAMREFTKKFVTPVSRVIQHDCGELLGTGNYIVLRGQRYLLTNEHVAKGVLLNSLAHQFLDNDTVFRVTNPLHTFAWPLDVAVSSSDEKNWICSQHSSAAIPEEKWAIAHNPVKGEILFFMGFSGERSTFLFGHLITQGTPYSAQEAHLPLEDARFKSRFHFALDYRPAQATPVNSRDTRGLPLPGGFSGSLVWNTRFVECWGKDPAWSPDDAEVTGLLWGWPSSVACVVATRVEYVRSFVLRATS